MKKPLIVIIGLVIIVGIVIYARGQAPKQSEKPSDESGDVMVKENIVTTTKDGFLPAEITIKQGESVTFVNGQENPSWPASDIHPTHTAYPNSGIQKCKTDEESMIFDTCHGLASGESYEFTFNEIGTWKFHDHLRPTFKGRVIVVEAETKKEGDTMMEQDDAMSEDGESAMEKAGEQQTITLTGKSFEFSQKEIRVKKGDKVTINFSSTDGFHDWVVDEFDAATDRVQTGENTSITFTADKTGTFEYYCSVGNHRAQGMVGTLIVK
ncbi:MAG: hypothetical protein COU08_01165 [Candidatus Harrisonbacteria bacterium CG10_big_fil_rev_8_21_14_0_10_42_17]|uniref:Blue (type 1) copper domain-containing protein n=1 Tax=Candidatus Harrisonbacteria bacterium CG10_big_fil_rev_8_21_14_0_10_42_17 TaxID=1974584 RepID=A0A2M6WIH1_9BACT|nr:MAG: hypothetical protein COU08_01165 [Candidatus Harrisonbacteria bacterium CG10_big_fil_rev_8_21_14_0_10_42_17]